MSSEDLHYAKSHGLGNDYLVVDMIARGTPLSADEIRLVCHRNFGVGSDGILALVPSDRADFGLRIYNPDASEAEKSGNGLRIFALYLRTHGHTDRDRFTIETAGGIVTAVVDVGATPLPRVTVDMGTATFPVGARETLEVEGHTLAFDAVSMGNPHAVFVCDELDEALIRQLGPAIENHPRFPHRTNLQFVVPRARDRIDILIWERGAGYTLASGSSSCAAVAACVKHGLTDRNVTVVMPGGTLAIQIDDDWDVRMEGPVVEICTGTVPAAYLARAGTFPV